MAGALLVEPRPLALGKSWAVVLDDFPVEEGPHALAAGGFAPGKVKNATGVVRDIGLLPVAEILERWDSSSGRDVSAGGVLWGKAAGRPTVEAIGSSDLLPMEKVLIAAKLDGKVTHRRVELIDVDESAPPRKAKVDCAVSFANLVFHLETNRNVLRGVELVGEDIRAIELLGEIWKDILHIPSPHPQLLVEIIEAAPEILDAFLDEYCPPRMCHKELAEIARGSKLA